MSQEKKPASTKLPVKKQKPIGIDASDAGSQLNPPGKNQPTKNLGGRPVKTFDWDAIAKMCKIQCKHEEIASISNTTVETLQAACLRDLKMCFSDYYAQKAEGGKKSLRRKQWSVAIDEGNVTMLIWLGKQYLGQTDKVEATGKDGQQLFGNINVYFGKEKS